MSRPTLDNRLAPQTQTIGIEWKSIGNMFLVELVQDALHDLQERVYSKRSLPDGHSIHIFAVAATAKPIRL
jgi:hypothetical protein